MEPWRSLIKLNLQNALLIASRLSQADMLQLQGFLRSEVFCELLAVRAEKTERLSAKFPQKKNIYAGNK